MASRKPKADLSAPKNSKRKVSNIGKSSTTSQSFDGELIAPSNQIELIFGLVGPTGADLDEVCNSLKSQLDVLGYQTKVIRLSELIFPFSGKSFPPLPKYERIESLMSEGTNLRRSSGQADIVGRLGIARMRAIRGKQTGDENRPPEIGVAYIVRSFKRPEEVTLYRDIYGKAFNLISVYAPRQTRINNLKRSFTNGNFASGSSTPEELAIRLINRDHEEDGKLGQQVGKTFPIADFFITNDSRSTIDRQLRRLVRLIFGDPYISPTKDEQGMFFAQSSALRSLDLSRQVGASIVNDDGDIIATGCNEVPKFGGGLYWEDDSPIARDFELGHDSNITIKAELVQDTFSRMRKKGWLSSTLDRYSDEQLAEQSLFGDESFIRDSRLFDVIEFGRAVHAEMAAITQAAKVGSPLKGMRMFCTTFPCHICARHIVASGIKELIFIEPYEKSRTSELFADSISIEPNEPSPQRSNFKSFVGVAPRRYMDFFAMASDRKTKSGKILGEEAIAAHPKIKRIVLTYLHLESIIIKQTVRASGQ